MKHLKLPSRSPLFVSILLSTVVFVPSLPTWQESPRTAYASSLGPAEEDPSAGATPLPEALAQHVISEFTRYAESLLQSPSRGQDLKNLLASSFRGALAPCPQEETPATKGLLRVSQMSARAELELDRSDFVKQLLRFTTHHQKIVTAEFEVVEVRGYLPGDPGALETTIEYDIVGLSHSGQRRQTMGKWQLRWLKTSQGTWQIAGWKTLEQTCSVAMGRPFADITVRALGHNPAYSEQLLLGLDHWRSTLDAAVGVTVHGNQGVSVGDIDNDGNDDFYVSQPAGLPNRLFRNNGDGTFTDITFRSGVGVLDESAMSLLADVDSDRDQDLIVVTSFAPLLFVNEGDLQFRYRPDAFRFSTPPRATFTSAAMADYDHDGDLDLYLCAYGYHLGAGTYRIATPYHDANNGPPNYLFRNEGNGTFVDVTESSGLNENNRRFSFAASWEDYDGDGWPDLYVANDFGKNNLYRNNGDGTFTDTAARAGVEDVGAGMSVSWLDYDRDGWSDLYVGNMWSAPGLRLTGQPGFKSFATSEIRHMYDRHAKGNSLFRNRADGTFEEVSFRAKVAKGRWAWSSDAIDFDNDGYEDLYIANGMVTVPDSEDLEEQFWREVVEKSPLDETPNRDYEDGWNLIMNLLHEGRSWNGKERNIFYLNNGDGTFSDVSGSAGLDFSLDSRSFATLDLDRDGDLDLILKSRNSPGLKILRNDMGTITNSVSFRLRGTRSNHDAAGARITVFTENGQIVKSIRIGTGFLSQHTKEVVFGLGRSRQITRVKIDWPSGIIQELEAIPINHRINVEEGLNQVQLERFQSGDFNREHLTPTKTKFEVSRSLSATWLIRPFPLPEVSLFDAEEKQRWLRDYNGTPVLLSLRSLDCPQCPEQLHSLQKLQTKVQPEELKILNVVLPAHGGAAWMRSAINDDHHELKLLTADEHTITLFKIIRRYLFNHRSDMKLPVSFLLNSDGAIEKFYQGPVEVNQVLSDVNDMTNSRRNRLAQALPFPGQFYATVAQPNYFQVGVAFWREALPDYALFYLDASLQANPSDAAAHYNLGTVLIQKGDLDTAASSFERALQLEPDYPEAHNNLGIVFSRLGRIQKAIGEFEASLKARPGYSEAANNLAALYAQKGELSLAVTALERAVGLDPQNVEILNNLGILYARSHRVEDAQRIFETALQIQPHHPDVTSNLAVVYAEQGKTKAAIEKLSIALRTHPDFDKTYLVLATLYVQVGDSRAAVKVLRTLLDRKPTHQQARSFLNTLLERK